MTFRSLVVVYALTEKLRAKACKATEALRKEGVDVELILVQKVINVYKFLNPFSLFT